MCSSFLGTLAIIWSLLYYMRYVPNSYKKLWGLAIAFAAIALVPAFIFELIGPDTFNCLHEMKAVVHGVSIEWFKILSWVISLPLGIYALYKRDLLGGPAHVIEPIWKKRDG